MMKKSLFLRGWAVLLAGLSGCIVQVKSFHTEMDWAPIDTAGRIQNILGRQADDWNRGDIESFMQAYWKSPDLTFSSVGRITRGWHQTLENYHKRYPSRKAMGHLDFSDLEITPMGDDAALVLGRWHVEREKPIGGAFTLIFRRFRGRWVIVHDHTSVDAR